MAAVVVCADTGSESRSDRDRNVVIPASLAGMALPALLA
jgi:hypothetical protein